MKKNIQKQYRAW